MSDNARARGALSPRALMLDQSWAVFVVQAQGTSLVAKDGKIQNSQTELVEEFGDSIFEDDGSLRSEFAEKWKQRDVSKLSSKLLDAMTDHCGGNYERMALESESGVFVNWTGDEHTLHDVWMLRNVTEAQAAAIAEKVGIKYWMHSKAMHEGKERIPLDLEDPPFFEPVPINSLPEAEREKLGSVQGLTLQYEGEGISKYVIDRLLEKHPRFKTAVGLLMFLCVSGLVVGWTKKRWPSLPFSERTQKLKQQLASWTAAGWENAEILEKMGFDNALETYTVAMVVRAKEEE